MRKDLWLMPLSARLRVFVTFLAASLIGPLAFSQSTNSAQADESLTWRGITLYGIVDIGLQYDTHAAPISDYYPAGSGDVVQKNSNNSVLGVTPSNLTQSRIGLLGKENLYLGDWSAIFRLETFFNPQSGEISDALKSLVQNNGKALSAQNTNVDSSIAGQLFEQSFAGVSSPKYGTVTFGRQNTLLADAVLKYDPESASQAFSLIGLSGTAAGGGDTQDRRLDSSLKYVGRFADSVHLGLQYKFQNASAQSYANGGGGEAYSAFMVSIGAELAGASVDALYVKIKDAIAASALNATQFAGLATLGYSSSDSLVGTASDNATLSLMGLYAAGPLTYYAGYEHITFENPSIDLAPGFNDIGGYVLAYVNNTTYEKHDKVLQVYWAGAKYAIGGNWTLTAAYYDYHQSSFASGALAGCSSTISSACSGNLAAASIASEYRFTKRFNGYAGAMWSNVSHGSANGFLETTNINPTIGVRFTF